MRSLRWRLFWVALATAFAVAALVPRNTTQRVLDQKSGRMKDTTVRRGAPTPWARPPGGLPPPPPGGHARGPRPPAAPGVPRPPRGVTARRRPLRPTPARGGGGGGEPPS